LARRIKENPSSPDIDADPTLQAIFAQLSWRNRAVSGVTEAITKRCRAAQRFSNECLIDSQSGKARSLAAFCARGTG
jgi:hypothetical protein